MEHQEQEPPGGEGEGGKHGGGQTLVGRKIIKQQAHGEVVEYDEQTHTYKVKFSSDEHVEELKWAELKDSLAPEISFKRFPQKKKELPSDDEAAAEENNLVLSSDEEDEEQGEEEAPGAEAEPGDENENENASETEGSFHDAETEIPEHDDEELSNAPERQPTSNSHRELDQKLTTAGRRIAGDEGNNTHDDNNNSRPELKKRRKAQGSEPEVKPEVKSEPESEPDPETDEPGETEAEAEAEEEEDDEEEDEEDEDEQEQEQELGLSDGGEALGAGDDSDSSINESDLEMITRKRKKKKRKHVLTLQRWRGYKKKRKLAAEAKKAALAAEDPEAAATLDQMVVTDAMEEVAPRKKSRTRKLAEVDEIQRKRQKIAMELKKKLAARSKSRKPKAGGAGGGGVEEEETKMVTPLAASRHLEDDEIKVSPYADSKPSPFDRGIKLRGRKLRKVFKGKVTRGEIADYDRRTRYYKVRYEDGEVEKLMWKHVEPMLVPFEQLHTWDDPESEALASVLAAEKQQQAKQKAAAAKTPKLKPLTLKRR